MMSFFFPGPPQPVLTLIVGAIIVVALTAYALLGGADFGGGVWDLLASGPRRDEQRALIAHAIGPIWEANHVWLIILIVVLFTCFPPAFAQFSITLHIPLSLMLIGIVLRGSAFTFRTYDSQHSHIQQRWGMIFSIASITTPILLGAVVGAIASGGVAAAATGGGSFIDGYITPWCNPFAIGVGVLALVVFAFLAAVYLTVEAEGMPALQEDFRHRALEAALAVIVISWAVLFIARATAPRVYDQLLYAPAAIPLHLFTGIAGFTAIVALWRRRYQVARIAAAAEVAFILWGWVIAQYPYVMPPTLTLGQAAAPPATLRAVIGAISVGAVILFPSLWYLFKVFKGEGSAFERVEGGSGH
jgi:cytochrome bd ubiquinol oxidase subunit II